MTETIFVSIPTMNDSEYLNTLEKLFDQAKHPDRIFVGTTIFWKQSDVIDGKKPFFISFINTIKKYYKNVKVDVLPWEAYAGVGFGRTEPLKHFNNEKYYLSLDSHTHFVADWDEKIIDSYKKSKKHFGSKRILTTYLPPYFPDGELLIKSYPDKYTKDFTNTVLDDKYDNCFLKETLFSKWQFFDYYGHISLTKDVITSKNIFPIPNDIDLKVDRDSEVFKNIIEDEFLPAKKISAHFTFTEADPWVTSYRICLDPEIQFWAEEFYQSCLSYARGYNLVWIKTPIFFHQYSNGKEENFSRKIKNEDLEDFLNEAERTDVYKNYLLKIDNYKHNIQIPGGRISENDIIKKLFNKKTFFGYLPRSMNAYIQYAGIDIYNQKCSPWWEVPKLNVIYK
jgi:hypothetical protein